MNYTVTGRSKLRNESTKSHAMVPAKGQVIQHAVTTEQTPLSHHWVTIHALPPKRGTIKPYLL